MFIHYLFSQPVTNPKLKDAVNVVWLEGESDNDMSAEIQAIFKHAADEGIDETDVYTAMLEVGIDADMVRRNVDDETADHMEEFCREYGLL